MSPINTMNNYEYDKEKSSENNILVGFLIEKVFQTREKSNRTIDLEFLEEKNKKKSNFKRMNIIFTQTKEREMKEKINLVTIKIDKNQKYDEVMQYLK